MNPEHRQIERHYARMLESLRSSWPHPVTLTAPGLSPRSQAELLSRLLHTLADRGLVTWEALRTGPAGLQITDATLTARGRAMLARAA